MATQSMKQSTKAVVAVVAVAAILVALRTIYQEQRRVGEAERGRVTVQQQLEAFKDGDFEKAFTFAAAGFHQQMTLQQFRRMVEEGYPQFANPREIEIGSSRWLDETLLVDVTVTGKDGVVVPATYALEREERDWKVAAVRSLAAPARPAEPAPSSPPEKDRPVTPAAPRPSPGAA